jgi:1-deoxy-D-xylulose-5-phosphate reductoisomerase
MKSVSILGSTGSIGCNALKVIEHLGDFRVVALGAGRNMDVFAEQIARFQPELVSCENEPCAEILLEKLRALNVTKKA